MLILMHLKLGAVIDDGVENHDDFNDHDLPGFPAGVNNTGGIPFNHPSIGHGVSCAGIIAATHNSLVKKGISPNSRIVPINIFPNFPNPDKPSGAAASAQIATAINWVWSPNGENPHMLAKRREVG